MPLNSLILLLVLILSPVVAKADSTHIATGPVTNWSYGWKNAPIGSFTPFQGRFSVFGMPAWFDGAQPYPYVAFNNSNTTVTAPGTGFRVPKNHVMLHPSNEGRLSVVRWTSDSNGTYQIQGLFSGLEGCGYRNVYIVVNSVVVFSQPLGGTAINSFSLLHGLASGGTVDFEVDNGGNGYTCDGVGLSVLITAL
jgi:hypothetical protein